MAISKTRPATVAQTNRPTQKNAPVKIASCSGECKYQEYKISDVEPVTASDFVSGETTNVPKVEAVDFAVKADARFQKVTLAGCVNPTECACQEASVELETQPIQYRKTISDIVAYSGSGQAKRVVYKVRFKVKARIVKGVCMPKPDDA